MRPSIRWQYLEHCDYGGLEGHGDHERQEEWDHRQAEKQDELKLTDKMW